MPDEVVKRILARLTELETDPRPGDVKKPKGRNAWRIRVGDYRVIDEVMTANFKSWWCFGAVDWLHESPVGSQV